MPDQRLAVYKCFDCGHEVEARAATAASFADCPKCQPDPGMLLVYTLDGQPVNRGYFPEAPHA